MGSENLDRISFCFVGYVRWAYHLYRWGPDARLYYCEVAFFAVDRGLNFEFRIPAVGFGLLASFKLVSVDHITRKMFLFSIDLSFLTFFLLFYGALI